MTEERKPPRKLNTGTDKPAGVIRAADVAALWTEEARKLDPMRRPISKRTVLSYLEESKPGGRYGNKPMPACKRMGLTPYWEKWQEQALRDWYNDRPGHGHGRGGRRRRPL